MTYSTNIQWDVGDNTMLYASVSTGFKSGGFDEAYSGAGYEIRLVHPITNAPIGEPVPGNDSSILEVEEEEVLAYELGAKMSLLDGAAELNLAVFRMEYDNLQTSSLIGDAFRVGNAGEAISQGVELDGRILLSERLTVGGALAYLDAYYEDFTGATCTTPQSMDPANNPGCLLEDGSNIVAPRQPGGQDLKDETLVFAQSGVQAFTRSMSFPWAIPWNWSVGWISTIAMSTSRLWTLIRAPRTTMRPSSMPASRWPALTTAGRWP